MKENLKPYAYKQSESYWEVRSGKLEVRVEEIGGADFNIQDPHRTSHLSLPKDDGVLFVERADELR